MATPVLHPPRKREAQVFPQVTWEQFEAIERSFAAIPGVKFRYLDGSLEIMPVSPEHEDFKSTIVRLLEVFMEEKSIRYYKRGGPSLGDQSLGARNEPDESYNLETRKSHPDLVIEVVITSGGIDKLEGYRRLGVTEVWFWEDGGFEIYGLSDGQYIRLDRSALLADLPIALLCRYITYFDQHDAAIEFRQALRSVNS
jgi:Uma2 family endonuclease